jgi:hypothetical protein
MVALIASVVLLVWGLITHGTFAGSGDEPHYLVIAHSVAFDGDLDLSNNYREATLVADGALLPESHAIEVDGKLRPVHDVGMPVVLAPIVRVAYAAANWLGDVLPPALLDRARLNKGLLLRHQLSLLMALLTGFLAREVYLLIRGLGGSARAAFGWALLCALTPPVLSHSFLFFTEIPTALLATFVFRKLSLRDIHTGSVSLLVGVITGFLLILHARNIGLVAGLVVIAVLMARRRLFERRLLPMFLIGVTAGVIGRTLVTYILWDSFIQTPHAALRTALPLSLIGREVFVRATGLLFDREYGLLAYAPIYCLAVAGLTALSRNASTVYRNMAIAVGCYLLPILLPVTNHHGWSGGWSPAARFLLPVVPLLWLPVYAFWAHGARAGQAVATVLLALQIAINAYVWQFPKTLWSDGDGVAAAPFTRWLPTWFAGDATLIFAVALAVLAAFVVLGRALTVTVPRAGDVLAS